MAYLTDEFGNRLVDELGNYLVTETSDVSIPSAEPNRLPRGQVHYPDGWHFVRALAMLLIGG